MNRYLEAFVEKFSQESTWRGIIQASMAFGLTLEPAKQTAIITIGMLLLGTINFAKNPPPNSP
jgi:hypothetical protein